MNTIAKSFLFIILTSVTLIAQTDDFEPGSPYTLFGVGELNYNNSLRTLSMGINGIALPGDYINSLNPAANYDLTYTKFSLAGRYSFHKYSDDIQSGQNSDGHVDGLNIGIPISNKDGIALILGFNRLSSVAYEITQFENSFIGNEKRVYSGKGGLSRINIGLTYKLANAFVLGAEYNYGFGNIVDEKRIDFQTQGVTNTTIRKEIDLQQSYLKAGTVIDFSGLSKSRNLKDLRLGFYYQTKINFNTSGDAIYTTSLSVDTVRINEASLEFPASFGVGISNKFGDRYIVSADMLMHNWDGYISDKLSIAKYENSYRLGLGVDIIPPQRSALSFWQRMSYRFGVFYGQEYYSINGENVNFMGAAAGLNIPLTNLNSLDLSLRYMQRGKNTGGLIKDEVLSLSLGFNYGELWFLSRPEED